VSWPRAGARSVDSGTRCGPVGRLRTIRSGERLEPGQLDARFGVAGAKSRSLVPAQLDAWVSSVAVVGFAISRTLVVLRIAAVMGTRDTGRVMSEESTTPDLVELTRQQFDAVNSRDMDAVIRRCTPDAVYDTSPDGMGLYEGPAAIRDFARGWWDAFEELILEPEEVLDLGQGFVLAVVWQRGRPANSTGRLERREAYILEWVEGMIRRVTVYSDVGEGRAAAERLAEERG
jgi:ketosteroid isomerase-like protein